MPTASETKTTDYQILFRPSPGFEDELKYCQKYFKDTATLRSDIAPNKTVIGRYSTIPFYHELEQDLASKNSVLINSLSQHEWIADMKWYSSLSNYTFETWEFNEFSLLAGKVNMEGQYVVKGATTSKKNNWSRSMFAKCVDDVFRIAADLRQDLYIGQQKIFVRKYVNLKTYETGIGGLPFTNEWRFFYFNGRRVDFGYYWVIASDETIEQAHIPNSIVKWVDDIAQEIKYTAPFVVIDVAEDINGKWWVVELNDGQMSGLPFIPEERFYQNLRVVVLQHQLEEQRNPH